MYSKTRSLVNTIVKFHMETYSVRTGRTPDFRIRYDWIDQSQALFQHMRSDFRYSDDEENVAWMIWPEFEGEKNQVISDGRKIPESGSATMWIVSDEPEARRLHRERLKVRVKGYLVVGATRIAEANVIEILGIGNDT